MTFRILRTLQGHAGTPAIPSIRPLAVFPLLVLLAFTTGCETAGSKQQAELTMVAITETSQVAGKWEGLLRRVPPSRTDAVTLVVLPDGRYRFTSVRMIGLLTGEGTFAVANGHLTSTTERGSMEAILFEGDGRRMLRATGQSSDGLGFIVELSQAAATQH